MSKLLEREIQDALLALTPSGWIAEHRSEPWKSPSFSGTKHKLYMVFPSWAELGKLEAALPDHELAIAGQLVADAKAHDSGEASGTFGCSVSLVLLEDA